MRGLTAGVLLVLMVVMALPPSIAPAAVQGRRGNRQGGDSRLPPPQEGASTPEWAGSYGFSTPEVLEAAAEAFDEAEFLMSRSAK